MWLKIISFTILFFLLALLQARFLPYFGLAGSSVNLVFILFFLLVFLNQSKNRVENYYINIYFAIFSGFLLDCFSILPFGVYIILFLIINFFIWKMQGILKESHDVFPFSYFSLLFIISFIFSEIFIAIFYHYVRHLYPDNLSWIFLLQIIYNFLFTTGIFYIYKKLFKKI